MYYWNPQKLKELKAAGYKLHAAPEAKVQAPSLNQNLVQVLKFQATSPKLQARSSKLQAGSNKLPDP